MPGKQDKMNRLKAMGENKPETRSIRFQVLLTPSVAAELEEWSKKTGASKNEIVNVALEQYMSDE